jgi:hypothetical protein
MRAELEAAFADRATTTRVDPFAKAAAMREPIFYGAESAWGSQYRDFAVQRYARDADWLQKNKGFTPEEGKKIIAAINDFLNGSILATLKAMKTLPRSDGLSSMDFNSPRRPSRRSPVCHLRRSKPSLPPSRIQRMAIRPSRL